MEIFPLNCDNVKGPGDIWGDNLGCLNFKATQRRTTHIRATLVPTPIKILQRYHNMTLAVDVIYVNVIHLINTILCHIKFMTAEHIAGAESITLKNSIIKVKKIYMQHGPKVNNILMYDQFECIHRELANLQTHLNVF